MTRHDRSATRAVRDALASHAADYGVCRRLHDVPPHAVYEVTVEGTRAVCKIARGPAADPATEARVLEYVRAHTPVPVPRVLAVGRDHFLAEWHDGVPEDPSVDGPTVRTMGRGLATLHAAAADDFDASGRLRAEGGRPTVDADERWSDTLVALLADRRDYLDGAGYGDLAREALAFVRDHRDLFAVDDATLVHGNFLPEHVGIEGGEVACVVDFEHALAGPGEWDYLRTVLPLFGGARGHGVPRGTFREAYESVRPLPPGFDRRRVAYRAINAVSYLKALHVQRADRDPPAELARRAYALREHARSSLEDLRTELG